MNQPEVLNILQYLAVSTGGLTAICGLLFDSSAKSKLRDLKRGEVVAVLFAIVCLVGAVVAQHIQNVQADSDHQADLARIAVEQATAADAKKLADNLDLQLTHLNQLAGHVIYELPESTPGVADLFAELDQIRRGPSSAVPRGVAVYNSTTTYVYTDRLLDRNPLAALAKLQPYLASMSNGQVSIELRLHGDSTPPDLVAKLKPTAGYCSLCYLPGPSPHLYARWQTVTIAEHSDVWSSNGAGISIRDLSGARLKIAIFQQPNGNLNPFAFFKQLPPPTLTLYFNQFQCLFTDPVCTPDDATPNSLVYKLTVPDAAKIMDGTAMKFEPCLDLF